MVPLFTEKFLGALLWYNKDLNNQMKKNKAATKIKTGVFQDETFERSILEDLMSTTINQIWTSYFTNEMYSKIFTIYMVEIGAVML